MPPTPNQKAPAQKPENQAQAQKPAASPAPAQKSGGNTILGFNPTEFAKTLTNEAAKVIPQNIKEPDRKFITDIIYKFCIVCGEALAKDKKITLNAEQATLITQFIAEWTFHKSIDLVNGGIPPEMRETVLQKVAFTVFEMAKQAILKNLPQEQIVQVIEIQVNKSFKAAIADLQAKGRIDETLAQQAMAQSNIDAMNKQQGDAGEDVLGADLSDLKILKLASLALLVKKLPENKAKIIFQRLSKSESEVLLQYVKMPNLESKVDKRVAIQCLSEIKEALPEPKTITMDRVYSKLFKIVKSCDKNEISNIIENERPIIKQFVLSFYTKDEVQIPVRVGNIVCKYLEAKISNDN